MRKTVARFAGGDITGELLRGVRVESSVLCRSVMGAPWGFGVAGRDAGSFHMVIDGSGWLEVEGSLDRIALRAGDLVVLPKGDAHWVRDAPTTTAPWLTSILDRHEVVDGELHFGADDGPTTEIVCGVFTLEGQRPRWMNRLPSVVASRSGGAQGGWRSEVGASLRDEARNPTRGGAAVVNRLLEALLVDALRNALVDSTRDVMPPARAISDERIGSALARIHDAPEEVWTVERMAKTSVMSRSAFADRFRSLVGVAPMTYVTELRLARAARLLRSTDMTVAEIAGRVGYGSEAALARAFRSRFDVAPAAFRRRTESNPLPKDVTDG
jgi:AraC family transcriptional regulator, alkane utilization regulator